ncbi:MAG TPA: glycoside hydrolase family 44 protein, partial [Polyangiaceae bacterium]|nr:glycoside hydrolase family 44 protein [Polyangiaceae bacterium]
AKVAFAGYGGIVLHHAELRSAFGALSFRYKPPGDWPEFLAVNLKRAGTPDSAFAQVAVQPRHVATLDAGWREVLIDWSELDPDQFPVDRITIVARSTVDSGWVLLDKIVLTKSTSTKLGKAPTRDAGLEVMCDGAAHAISPLIYGAAVGDWDSGQSAQRIGGNLMSRLNWDSGFWNSGNDWFFENGQANGTIWEWIDAGVSHSAPNAVTVPMLGWVAKDATSVGFPKTKFSKQRKFDDNRPEAGDGVKPDGTNIQPGPATETSVAAPPELIGRWVRTLREKDKARGKRGAQMYILDNEPSLWSSTHRDVHPEPVTYDELLSRTVHYATEIRKADPDAVIAGPAEWGWRGYFFSGKDQAAEASLRPDRLTHGDVPLIPWYLQKLAAQEKTSGDRLLDVLDVHFYPAADKIYGQNARVDADGAELRIRSTRALWDRTYKDESWINEPIRLIPRLKEWVAQNYPGRKISIGEWSFGADAHISGGVATAEALGRFGKEGLDSAFYWDGPKANTATFWAFRVFRNFDGAGARFLDTSLPTHDSDKISIFASRDDSGAHVVAIVVNRDPIFAVNARVDLNTCGRVLSSRAFSYGPSSSALAEVHVENAEAGSVVVAVQPYSFTAIDLRLQRP